MPNRSTGHRTVDPFNFVELAALADTGAVPPVAVYLPTRTFDPTAAFDSPTTYHSREDCALREPGPYQAVRLAPGSTDAWPTVLLHDVCRLCVLDEDDPAAAALAKEDPGVIQSLTDAYVSVRKFSTAQAVGVAKSDSLDEENTYGRLQFFNLCDVRNKVRALAPVTSLYRDVQVNLAELLTQQWNMAVSNGWLRHVHRYLGYGRESVDTQQRWVWVHYDYADQLWSSYLHDSLTLADSPTAPMRDGNKLLARVRLGYHDRNRTILHTLAGVCEER